MGITFMQQKYKNCWKSEWNNIFKYFLPDAPYCKPDQVQVFGVAREETARISCEVLANPQSYIYFEWRFNTTGEMVDMPHDRFR